MIIVGLKSIPRTHFLITIIVIVHLIGNNVLYVPERPLLQYIATHIHIMHRSTGQYALSVDIMELNYHIIGLLEIYTIPTVSYVVV